MRYRTFGRLDWKPSALGFGAMRLPVLDNDPAQIDEPQAIRMIRLAIDHGVNYVDSGYTYHGGKSEGLVGRALGDGYRAKAKVATKSPIWLLEKPEDPERYLGEQLERLGVDCIDFYLLHGLNARQWPRMRELRVLDWAERARTRGLIAHLGFSFHDSLTLFKEIINGYDGWEFCQIQYNYMDENAQAGLEGLRYAAGKGLGVVVMEPIRGGALASPPAEVRRLWEAAPGRRSPAEWALQWVWNHPEVSLVLSGMSTMAQVEENATAAGRSGPGTLGRDELSLIRRVRQAIRDLGWIPCTACGYCQPCPNEVRIPDIFGLYNDAIISSASLQKARRWYAKQSKESRADACAECGDCEEKCPQHLAIQELLAKAHETLKTDDA